jgi:hypothetical protein
MILAIDPGSTQSGIAYVQRGSYEPRSARKLDNEEVFELSLPSEVVIEMVAHYGTGMPAGKTVFDTAVWIGRFYQHFTALGLPVELMMRGEVKMNICGTMRAKDSNIIQALVDRFAPGARNYGKGTKKEPGWFYGFSADIWQAYALGVTYLDRRSK